MSGSPGSLSASRFDPDPINETFTFVDVVADPLTQPGLTPGPRLGGVEVGPDGTLIASDRNGSVIQHVTLDTDAAQAMNLPAGLFVDRRATKSIAEPGQNCWRIETAERAAPLVDAADYFKALQAAFQRARESIWILGWDIHSQTPLLPPGEDGRPVELVDVLRDVTRRNKRLRVRLLIWDPAPIYVMEREFSPLLRFSFRTGPRVQLRFASDHVVSAAHHQKIVVIDDRIAFLGGIDLTAERWDTRKHEPDDPRRTSPAGRRYGPFHDVQLAVDGDAARALGDLARHRWWEATGKRVPPTDAESDPWPDNLNPMFRHVEIALARTQANYQDRPAIREVERLYLDAVAAAERHIYIENQYLTSTLVCDALACRLEERDGPEVVIVTPRDQSGRLAEDIMGALRVGEVKKLRAADKYDRLRIVSPVVPGDVPVNVHAKVMVIDDAMMRMGSANLSNRSMGIDTECDAFIEARDDDETRRGILDFRNGLIAEHLGASPEQVRSELECSGSMSAAIDALNGNERRLEKLDVDAQTDHPPIDPHLADPNEPIEETLARRVVPEESVEARERTLPKLVVAAVITLAFAGLAAWWSLNGGPEAEQFVAALEKLKSNMWGPPAAAAILAVAALCLLPVNALIVAVVFVFGPWVGVCVGLAGSLMSACAGYGIGRALWRDTVRAFAGDRVNRLSDGLGRRGVTAVIAIRVIPVAPFTIANLVAGSSRIGFRDFVIGTLIGMMPGILVFAFASDRVIAAARTPDATTIAQAVGAILLLGAGSYWLFRFLKRRVRRRSASDDTHAS